jgi:hypothetical protein
MAQMPLSDDAYVEPDAAITTQAVPVYQSTRDASMLDGFGRDVPLALALQQIVPAGYAYALAPNVNAGVSLSWSGGTSWIAALNSALSNHGYQASVRGRTVLIMAPQSIAAFPASAIPDANFNATLSDSIVEAPSMPLSADGQLSRIWQAKPGDSVRRILNDWSSMSGVTLYWPDTSDYVLTKSIRVNGTYADAVDAVLTSLAAIQPRPVATLHTNKGKGAPILVIKEV